MKFKHKMMKIFDIDTTSLEWFLSLLGIAWGLWMALPNTNALLRTNPLYGREAILGIWLLVINILKLIYVYRKGKLTWRRFAVRSSNNIAWLVILISFVYSNPESASIPVYATMFLATTYLTLRSGLEEWVK